MKSRDPQVFGSAQVELNTATVAQHHHWQNRGGAHMYCFVFAWSRLPGLVRADAVIFNSYELILCFFFFFAFALLLTLLGSASFEICTKTLCSGPTGVKL